MPGRVEGKVALVTGAGSGNGRAIALALAVEGARVTCADVNAASAQQVADEVTQQGGAAIAVGMDVTRAADCAAAVQQTVDAFGGLDILVNNAGIWVPGTILALSEADWDRQQVVNAKGVFLMTKAALPAIIARGGGSVIMLASIAGLKGTAGSLAYNASKHAVIGLTRCLALDHAADGVRVNAICPGLIETRMGDQVLREWGREDGVEQTRRQLLESYPLGRLGRPEDVAAIAVHLASDESAWVTGTYYVVDGGTTLKVRV